MHATRRDFLRQSSLVAWGLSVPAFVSRTAHAAPLADQAGAKDTILVVVQLTGGNDGLNTVIPFKDPQYAKLRPTIKIAESAVLKLNDSLGLHPALSELAKHHESNELCVVQGVGYPNPNQSHFRSMDIWQAGSTADAVSDGWIGKALNGLRSPAFHVAEANEVAPLALSGAPARVPSILSLEDFQLKVAAASRADQQRQRALIESASAGSTPDGLLDFVQRTAVNTYASSRRLQDIGKNYQPKATYPQTRLANRLKLAAQLIDADLGARVFYVSIDGFDTHAAQGGATGAHANLWREVSGAIDAFYLDVAARGHKDRVCVMTFSEFGRRAHENGSKGTDHGSAAPMLLVGGKVKPGVVGEHPSLTNVPQGNLQHAIDFRSVYATVLDEWLGVRSKEVLGVEFPALELFA